MTVLVVYASRHGSTAGIAERIGTRLADCGAAVELRHVDQVEVLDGYEPGVSGRLVRDAECPVLAVPRGAETLLGELFSTGAMR